MKDDTSDLATIRSGIPLSRQVKYWGAATALFLAFLWSMGDILLPFLLGGAIAYFLDPIADRIERAGASRALATAIIATTGGVFLASSFLVVVPLLIAQATSLLEIAPRLAASAQASLYEQLPSVLEGPGPARDVVITVAQTIKDKGVALLNTALASVGSVFAVVMMMVITPVVSVYMLLDWDRMIKRVDELLPREHAPVIRQIASEIDQKLASFVRGQGTVCFILGVFYAIALMATGLQFGLVVGLSAGILTFIPYVGAIVGGALAIGLALFQFWGDWTCILTVAAIFIGGQLMEANVLTPKLVGDSVGLHPVWLMFAIVIFGSLFGFAGMLIAVPLAAALGVVARFGIQKYVSSPLYQGE